MVAPDRLLSMLFTQPIRVFFLFFSTYSLSMSSLGCKILWIVITFLAQWFIWLSSTFVRFKNGPEYLARGDCEIVNLFKISVAKLSRCSEVIVSYFFLHLRLFRYVRFSPPIFLSTWNFTFLQAFWFFLDLTVLFLPLFFFPLFIISMAHFSMLNSIPISWQHILFFCIRVSN